MGNLTRQLLLVMSLFVCTSLGLGVISPYLLHVTQTTGEPCDDGVCFISTKICASNTFPHMSPKCRSYRSDGKLFSNLADYSFERAVIGDVETALPATIHITVESMTFVDLGATSSLSSPVTTSVVVVQRGYETTTIDTTIGAENFTLVFALWGTCSEGSSGDTCTCQSGGYLEPTLMTISDADSTSSCSTCSMTANICFYRTQLLQGDCKIFTTNVIGSQETYNFNQAHFDALNFDIPGTLNLLTTLTRVENGVSRSTQEAIQFSSEITSEEKKTYSVTMTAFEKTYTMSFDVNYRCAFVQDDSGTGCYAETEIFLESVKSISSDSQHMTCTQGPCYFTISMRTQFRDVRGAFITELAADNDVNTGDVQLYTFNSYSFATFLHHLPMEFFMVRFATLVAYNAEGTKSEVYLNEFEDTVTEFGDKETTIEFLNHVDDTPSLSPFNLTIRARTSRYTVGQSPAKCSVGSWTSYINSVVFTDESGTMSCPDYSICTVKLSHRTTSRYSAPRHGIGSYNIRRGGEPMRFYFTSNLKTENLRFPDTYTLEFTLFLYINNTITATSPREYPEFKFSLDGWQDYKLTGQDPASGVAYEVKGTTLFQCGTVPFLETSECSEVSLQLGFNRFESLTAKTCASEFCHFKLHVCFNNKLPAKDGICIAIGLAQSIDNGTVIRSHLPESLREQITVQLGDSVYYAVKLVFYPGTEDPMKSAWTFGSFTGDFQEIIVPFVEVGDEFKVKVFAESKCIREKGIPRCPDRDHYDCRLFKKYSRYYCHKYKSICHTHCPYMCGVCKECWRTPCIAPHCVRSQYGCRYEPPNGIMPTSTECATYGICGQDHSLCQVGFSGRNHFHPCHRCKYPPYAKHICPITCGLCPAPCDGKRCENGGYLDVKTCRCKCPPLYTGDTCQTLKCPDASDDDCDWPLWMCDKYWVPKQCAFRCCICTKEEPL